MASDIERVKQRDRAWSANQYVLQARMKAVIEAQRAVRDGEAGAVYGLRDALIDLAAVSEELAGELRSEGDHVTVAPS